MLVSLKLFLQLISLLVVLLQECDAFGFTFDITTRYGVNWWEDGSSTNLKVFDREGNIVCTAAEMVMFERYTKQAIFHYQCDQYIVYWNPHGLELGADYARFYTTTEDFGETNCIRHNRGAIEGPPLQINLSLECHFPL